MKELGTEASNPPPKPKGTALTKAKRSQATLENNTEAQPTTDVALQVVQPKAKKVKVAPEPREDLPKCKGCNNHPGTIMQPRSKCTSAEVTEEKAAKEEMKRRLAELEEEKKTLYAQMEIDEDERDLERQVNAVRRLSHIVQPRAINRCDVDSTTSEGEEFDMDVDVSSDSDDEPEKKDKVSSIVQFVFKLGKNTSP